MEMALPVLALPIGILCVVCIGWAILDWWNSDDEDDDDDGYYDNWDSWPTGTT